MKVHSSTEAILIDFAILADAFSHPIAIAEDLETVFPNVEEVILIDIALGKAPVDVPMNSIVAMPHLLALPTIRVLYRMISLAPGVSSVSLLMI